MPIVACLRTPNKKITLLGRVSRTARSTRDDKWKAWSFLRKNLDGFRTSSCFLRRKEVSIYSVAIVRAGFAHFWTSSEKSRTCLKRSKQYHDVRKEDQLILLFDMMTFCRHFIKWFYHKKDVLFFLVFYFLYCTVRTVAVTNWIDLIAEHKY